MLETLLDIALDLTRAGPDEAVYQRLLAGVRKVLPADATALMRHEDGVLIPLAVDGLSPQVLGRRFQLSEHPRLRALCASSQPVRFPADDPRPDPFDGLVEGAVDGRTAVHACMGCSLSVAGELVGVLTVDALEPGAFEAVSDDAVAMFAALAGATLRVAAMFEALQGQLAQCQTVAQTLTQEALHRQGGELLGNSLPMQHLRREVHAVATSGVTVLVQGETGTGKELVARTIHAESDRADRPLVYVNCAALPEALAESEFFGHVRGAFTGAMSTRPGKFELANGGTLFLDEIGELPPAIQPKLLRALQEGELQRIGADRVRRVDVRVIAATNRDLETEVRSGQFRADLYHRLSVYPIIVPPLRTRGDDVLVLAGAFLDRCRVQLGLERASFTDPALRLLQAYRWPGNVRELQHVVTRAMIRARDIQGIEEVVIGARLLDIPGTADSAGEEGDEAAVEGGGDVPDFHAAMARYQRRLIERAVRSCDGNWAAAARAMKLDRSNLHRMAKRLGLK